MVPWRRLLAQTRRDFEGVALRAGRPLVVFPNHQTVLVGARRFDHQAAFRSQLIHTRQILCAKQAAGYGACNVVREHVRRLVALIRSQRTPHSQLVRTRLTAPIGAISLARSEPEGVLPFRVGTSAPERTSLVVRRSCGLVTIAVVVDVTLGCCQCLRAQMDRILRGGRFLRVRLNWPGCRCWRVNL